jgi:hypothetical protein
MPAALQEAVQDGSIQEIRRVLQTEDGAKLVDETSTDVEFPPLLLAAQLGNEDAVEALLDAGADVMIRDYVEYYECLASNVSANFYADALQIAAMNGHISAIKLLLARTIPQPCNSKDHTHPIILAAMFDRAEALKLLLERYFYVTSSTVAVIKAWRLGMN